VSPPEDEIPPTGSDASLRGAVDSPSTVAGASPDEAGAEPLPREILRDFLSRPLTLQWLTAFVRRRVSSQRVEDVRQDVLVRALEATSLPSVERALPSWMRTIAERTIAGDHTKRVRRKEHEKQIDELRDLERLARAHGVAADVAGEMDDEAAELTYDPRDTMHWDTHRFLIRPWIEAQVRDNARDKETLDLLLEKASSGKTYDEIAAAHGMSLTALAARVFQFKKKYLPRYQRDRNRAIVLLLLFAAVMLALLVWALSHRSQGTDRQPNLPPVPSASAPSPARPRSPGLFEPYDVAHPRPRGEDLQLPAGGGDASQP
jgi:DNA-directed RNA polymerase specialized sigma24 family protein